VTTEALVIGHRRGEVWVTFGGEILYRTRFLHPYTERAAAARCWDMALMVRKALRVSGAHIEIVETGVAERLRGEAEEHRAG
jgi:hypothetical protein